MTLASLAGLGVVESAKASADSIAVTFKVSAAGTPWTVPANIYSIHIHAVGGSGNAGSAKSAIKIVKGGIGGLGGVVDADLAVTPGEQFYVIVGAAGTPTHAGGGSSAGGPSGHDNRNATQLVAGSGNGGGATGLFRAGRATPLMVASGGGGGGGAGFAEGGDGGNGGGNRGYAGKSIVGGAGGSGSSGSNNGGTGEDSWIEDGGGSGGGGGGYTPDSSGGGAAGKRGIPIPLSGAPAGGGAGGRNYSDLPNSAMGVATDSGDGLMTISASEVFTTTAVLSSNLNPAYLGQKVRFSLNPVGISWTNRPREGMVTFGTYDPSTGIELPQAYMDWNLPYDPFWNAPQFPVGLTYVWASFPGDATHSAWKSPYLMQVTYAALQTSISVSPTSLDFGAQPLGSSTVKSITVLNTGGAVWKLGSLALTDVAFTVSGGTCSATPLDRDGLCTWEVTYKPTAAAALNATLALTEIGGTITRVPLSGLITAPPPTTTTTTTTTGPIVSPVGPPPAQGVPTVTLIAPAFGPKAGGTRVTITGTNLVNVRAVKFGGRNATNIVCATATTCTVTTPPGSGTVHVRITTPAGVSTTATRDRFSYSG